MDAGGLFFIRTTHALALRFAVNRFGLHLDTVQGGPPLGIELLALHVVGPEAGLDVGAVVFFDVARVGLGGQLILQVAQLGAPAL